MNLPRGPALTQVSQGAVQRLHRIAHGEGWEEVKIMCRRAMTTRQVDGRPWRDFYDD